MTDTRLSFATVGDNCIDRYLPLGQAAVGGNAANVAVQIRFEGESCAYFGAVGRDAAGRWTRKALGCHGVDLGHLQDLDAPTAFTNLDVDPQGERCIAYEDFGATALYRPTAREVSALAAMDHVHIGWLNDAHALRKALAGPAVSLSQDVAVNPDASGVDVGFDSSGPSETLARAALGRLQAAGCRVAVVTCGSMGSIAWAGGDVVTTGIRSVPVVRDTTGAGDTFIAGFLVAWKRGRPLVDCLVAGRDAAARTCGHLGGFPQTLRPFDHDGKDD